MQLATSFTDIHAHAAPVVASSLSAQVDLTFDGTLSVESGTPLTGTPGWVGGFNDNDNGIDFAVGHAIVSTNGGTYVASQIRNYIDYGIECEVAELCVITNEIPPA